MTNPVRRTSLEVFIAASDIHLRVSVCNLRLLSFHCWLLSLCFNNNNNDILKQNFRNTSLAQFSTCSEEEVFEENNSNDNNNNNTVLVKDEVTL